QATPNTPGRKQRTAPRTRIRQVSTLTTFAFARLVVPTDIYHIHKGINDLAVDQSTKQTMTTPMNPFRYNRRSALNCFSGVDQTRLIPVTLRHLFRRWVTSGER